MDPPVVYIEKEPFLIMLMSAVDPFKRECLGYLVGKKPNRRYNSYLIESVVTVSSARMRKNSEIEQSQGSLKRMRDIFNSYNRLYPLVGDFHSHPEWGTHDGSPELTDKDIADMKVSKPGYLEIVIGISTRKRQSSLAWQVVNGCVKGSLSKYIFEVNAYVLSSDLAPNRLEIVAASAIKTLNHY